MMAGPAGCVLIHLRGCSNLIQRIINPRCAQVIPVQVQFWGCHAQSIKTPPSSDPFAKPKPPRPKTEPPPQVNLISAEGKMTVSLLEEAQKLAKRRDMQLVKASDPDGKSHRATYRLVPHGQISGEMRHSHAASKDDKAAATTPKHEKLLTIASKIDTHDLAARTKQVTKWLQKNCEVRVTITGETDPSEKVSEAIEKAAAGVGGRVVQKRSKDQVIKYSILPPVPSKTEPAPVSNSAPGK